MLQRRTFILAAAGSLIALRSGLASEVFEDITFKVVRKGTDVGRHAISFKPDGDRVTVTNAIDIRVKLAFITVGSFKQDAVDVWQGDNLIRCKSRIVDSGDISDVTMEADGDQLVVQGPKGRVRVPLGTMTDISFWNQNIVHQSILLDTQTTDLIDTTTTGGVEEMVDLGDGREVPGIRYEMTGSLGRSGQIWYNKDGRFLRTSFTTRGEKFEYYPLG
ncbi:DUF6134 family protein [Geminicoccus roseus]|uniref:DUF6134 family protein n=1 Tax=Geminicoccus roseus TaxID=404900 RepID=UPI00041EACCA|nr:DUF6134 family protein [Geminicoccus roseus]